MQSINRVSILCEYYFKLYGSGYLQQLLKTHVKNILLMNPASIDFEKEAMSLLDNFNRNSVHIPYALLQWCQVMREVVTDSAIENPSGMLHQWICDVFLYRWLLQAIVFPEHYGLLETYQSVSNTERSQLTSYVDRVSNCIQQNSRHPTVTAFHHCLQSLIDVSHREPGFLLSLTAYIQIHHFPFRPLQI
jgi:hypothetical protein